MRSKVKIVQSGNNIIFPDSYPAIDASNLLSTATTYTATEPCFALTKGSVTINGVAIRSAIRSAIYEGICVILDVGDTITANTIRIYGISY